MEYKDDYSYALKFQDNEKKRRRKKRKLNKNSNREIV
jgi:hypothetical protein